MSYSLGIDLGTTFTAAAVWRDGQITMATLGTRTPEIPTIVAYSTTGDVLVGEPAGRRAITEPESVAREFKRRVGDPVPFIVAGVPRSSESLMAIVLAHVIAKVSEAEGSAPTEIAVTYPASWGPYKTAQLDQIFQLAGCPGASTMTEPEAAARHYAAQQRLEPGSTVAVFDFGGGTFDAAILHYDSNGSYRLVGEPKGVERLGGLDLDHAVFQNVIGQLGFDLSTLEDTQSNRSALARLRDDCVTAKETLSSDTVATVPVMLPDIHTQVRLTRTEFEDMIRPAVIDAIAAIDATITSGGIQADDVTAILLVGGSSRIPLVSQLVTQHFNRPTLVDAHPKHAIAAGAVAHSESVTVIAAPSPAVSEVPTLEADPPTSTVNNVLNMPARPSTPTDQLKAPETERTTATESRGSPAYRLVFGLALLMLATAAGAWLILIKPDVDDAAPQNELVDTTIAPPTQSTTASTTAAEESPPTTASPIATLIGDQIGRASYGGGSQVASLPDRGPEQPPQLEWQIAADRFTGPVGIDDVVYVSLFDDAGLPHLAAFDANSGTELWVSDLTQVTSIIVTDHVVINHWLLGFRFHDPTTGDLIDEIALPPDFGTAQVYVSEAVLRDGHIFAAGGYGEGPEATSFAMAIDLTTGEPSWIYEDQSLGWNPIDQVVQLASDGSTIVMGNPNAVIALDATTGIELWRSLALTGKTQFLLDGGFLVTSPEPKINRGLDARTGEVVWEFTDLTTPIFASDGTNFYVVSERTELQARRLATGDIVWTAAGPAPGEGSWSPTVAIGGDLIYVVDNAGPAAAFRLSTGQLIWSSTLEGLSGDYSIGLLRVSTAGGRLLIYQDETVKVYG